MRPRTLLALAGLGFLFALVLAPVRAFSAKTPEHGTAEHVVIIVWDGMRPDFITPENTPNLFALAAGGVFFTNHHPVFVSSTEVNGTAMATGDYPRHSKIIANSEYLPEIEKLSLVGTEKLEVIRKGDEQSHGHYLGASTLAELVQRAGFPTAVAGTKGVALLLDRSEVRSSATASASVVLRQGKTVPAAALSSIVSELGRSFPGTTTYPNVKADAWTTEALTRALWKNGVPKLSMLWMSDPDYTQHRHGPGSPPALAALASVDGDLGQVLAALAEKGVRDKTDVFVVSDHGFSTISKSIDFADVLRKNGFHAARQFKSLEPGAVLVDGLGGSVFLYVPDHDRRLIRQLADFLMQYDSSSVILSRAHLPGTLPLSLVALDAETTLPDLVVALRWSHERSRFGAPGMICSDGSLGPGQGTHASLSRYDMHNTLVGNGPDLRPGFVDLAPTGNIDLAPTVLWILGLTADKKQDGRILREALVSFDGYQPALSTETKKAFRRFHGGVWRQQLTLSHADGSTYIDEGSGEATR